MCRTFRGVHVLMLVGGTLLTRSVGSGRDTAKLYGFPEAVQGLPVRTKGDQVKVCLCPALLTGTNLCRIQLRSNFALAPAMAGYSPSLPARQPRNLLTGPAFDTQPASTPEFVQPGLLLRFRLQLPSPSARFTQMPTMLAA